MKKSLCVISTIILIILIFSLNGFAQTPVAQDFFPSVTTGNKYPEFNGVPVEELFLFAYRNSSWEMIPFQIDERNSQGNYFLPDDIAGLDNNDELSFLMANIGDLYPPGTNAWISDPDSRLYPRYQIAVSDSASGIIMGYVYLYRSGTLLNQAADLIEYRPGPVQTSAADTVQGLTFTMGHHEKGFVDYLAIRPSVGGSGIDIFDRQKFRIEIEFIFPLFVNEDNFENAAVSPDSVVDGKIRVLKKLNLDVVVFGSPINLSLFMQYFPYSVSISTALDLDSLPLPFKLVRQSLDLSNNASGMTFYNMNVPAGVPIDGNPDNVPVTPILFAPQVNWNHISGSQGTKVSLFRFAPLGAAQFGQYYKDNDAIDPDDTGDRQSFGDSGFIITELQNSTGTLPLDINEFFLAPNLASLLAEQLALLQEFPPVLEAAAQMFSAITLFDVAHNSIPATFILNQNFPNPFNPTTLISWQLPVSSPVHLSVFNLAGQKVAVLLDSQKPAGFHQIEFDATGLASGVYLYRLEAGNYSEIKKMVLMK